MIILLIVLAAIVVLAAVFAFGGGFGGYGGGYGDGPVVHRRIIHRRPARRVYTEHRIVEEADPIDGPVYRP